MSFCKSKSLYSFTLKKNETDFETVIATYTNFAFAANTTTAIMASETALIIVFFHQQPSHLITV